MKKYVALFCLALLFSGMFGAFMPQTAFAQEGETKSGTETKTETKTEEPESAAAEAARTRPCPERRSLLPVKLGTRLGSVSEVDGLGDYINEAYRYGVGIVLIIAIVMVVYGGFRYLAGSSIGDVARGKEIIRDAIVGMLIVLGAYTILQTINPATTNLQIEGLTTVGCQELNLVAAQLEEGRCRTNADCEDGERCVETSYVFNTHESDPGLKYAVAGGVGGAVIGGGIPGAIIGGAGGYVYGVFSNLGRTIMMCTDGRAGSPCGEDEHCTQEGVICVEDWTICIQETGNPPRSPCDDDSQCRDGECVGGNQSLCRGSAPILTNEVLRSVGFSLRRLADESPQYTCTRDHDCAEPGASCSGPYGSEVKFCVPGSAWVGGVFGESYRTEEDQIELGSICFIGQSGVLPLSCSGAGDAPFRCLVCPPDGERNWEVLNSSSDPERTRIGSCRNRSDVGTRCAGGS